MGVRHLRSQVGKTPEPEGPAGPRVVKDAHGQVLVDGECVVLTKDLPLKGSSQSFKGKRHAEHLCWSGGIDAIGIGLWPR